LPGFDVCEFRVFDVFDRDTQCRPERNAMSINLAERVVATRLGAGEQPVDALDLVEASTERKSHYRIYRQPRRRQQSADLFECAWIAARPIIRQLVPVEGPDKRLDRPLNPFVRRGKEEICLESAQSKRIPNEIDHVPHPNLLQHIPRDYRGRYPLPSAFDGTGINPNTPF